MSDEQEVMHDLFTLIMKESGLDDVENLYELSGDDYLKVYECIDEKKDAFMDFAIKHLVNDEKTKKIIKQFNFL